MEQQVLLRRRRLQGDPIMDRVNVISEDTVNGTLTIRAQGSFRSEVVSKADVMPVAAVYGPLSPDSGQRLVRQFPESRHALCNSLRRSA